MSKESTTNSKHRPGPSHHGPMMMAEKPKNFKKTFRRLFSYLKPQKWAILFVILASVFATLFNVVSPKILGDATSSIFDSFTSGLPVDFSFLAKLLIFLMGLYVLASFFSFIQQFIMAGISQRIVAGIRKEVKDKFTRLPLAYFDKHSTGDLLSRAVNDIDNINNSLQQALTQIITSVITIIGIILMMLIISPLLSLVILVTIPLSLLVIRLIAKMSQKYFVQQQKELGAINGHVEEIFSGHQVVKAYGQEEKAIEDFNVINEKLYQTGWRSQFISGLMMPLMMFVSNIGYILVSIVGGLLVINNSIRIGDVQAFIQYTQQISQPMTQVASVANLIQTALASAERIFELLDEEEEIQEDEANVELSHLASSVEFHRITFGYEPDKPVINPFSLDVSSGQTIAIVGPTGAGKTTLINLLLRFYEVNEGSIKVDGVSLQELSRKQARSLFAMVLQDTWLFKGTIYDNIAYGKEGATKEEVVAAAKKAFADDFIRTLPDGYDTILSEDASNISQGQRQLLTIARAILSEPKILILDEATSSVDTRTEMNIQHAMKDMMIGRTSFVIAHRLSTIKDADLILVLNKGDIVEKGSHQQLLDKEGFYAELYQSQFDEHSTS
ncbi:ABC transporter ATP-binding and permease protein [Bacillus sp. TS-2]|nr:ABC transporter ATP-binding and permease protein [Bacillus sp. TS-2]